MTFYVILKIKSKTCTQVGRPRIMAAHFCEGSKGRPDPPDLFDGDSGKATKTTKTMKTMKTQKTP